MNLVQWLRSLSHSQAQFDDLFVPDPLLTLATPMRGTIELGVDCPPRVRFEGTSWCFRVDDSSLQITLTEGQEVIVLGRAGNCLLVKL